MDGYLDIDRPCAGRKPAQTVATLATLCVIVTATVFVRQLRLATATSHLNVAGPVAAEVATREPIPVAAVPVIPVPVPVPQIFEEVAGHSVLGKTIPLIRFGTGPAVLIMASIHGSESAGTHIVERLRTQLMEAPAAFPHDRCVLLMPLVNPDGVEKKQRGNAHGVDLNRNFPAENRENSKRYGLTALSEPESLAVYRVVERFQPIRIVTLHEPLRCVDYDGPGLDLATAMAKVCPLDVKKLGTRPGSMGAFTGEERQIPTITLELPRDAKEKTADELWELYGPALILAVTHPLEPDGAVR